MGISGSSSLEKSSDEVNGKRRYNDRKQYRLAMLLDQIVQLVGVRTANLQR